MRTTQYLLSTLKEIPSDAELNSHRLMLRSGMIRKLASGFYAWLPIGLRVIKKVENILREEMNNVGAIEISLPLTQPAVFWKNSGRWREYGQELFRIYDRHKNEFILGPTSEESVIELVRNEVSSYRQLPLNLYQIQTKFRDELRPRFGVMRSREFIMKDAYSFHISDESLQETYNLMYSAYSNSFRRMGLEFRVVQADSGNIGGSVSHEFHALAKIGEDCIVFSNESNYAANINFVVEQVDLKLNYKSEEIEKLEQIDTSSAKNINDLITQFHWSFDKIVKTFIVKGRSESKNPFVALLVRSDHDLSEFKIEKIDIIFSPLTFVTEKDVFEIIGSNFNFLGPIGLKMPVIADCSVAKMSNFIAGANVVGKHYIGINLKRDLPSAIIKDIRKVKEGEVSPDGKGILQIKRGIEIGHIFKLGTKYSKIMKVFVKNKSGQNQPVIMGCYGIGITRVIAAVIEQNHDDRGIIWNDSLTPFEVAIIPINMHKVFQVKEVSEKLYKMLSSKGIDVFFDDRKANPGVMFSDVELIGIPHMIIIAERNLNKNFVEYRKRSTGEKQMIPKKNIIDFMLKILNKFF